MSLPTVIFLLVVLPALCLGRLRVAAEQRDKALRKRLQSVAAPFSGHVAVEELAPEESIFRPARRRSRLAWLLGWVEVRYPLVDAPRALPQVFAIGVLVGGAGAWAAMWVLGMAGWWSTPAAAIAGVGGAWYALGRLQDKLERQFIQQFPEIVDQIVRLSGAGLPPLEALSSVAEDAQKPVQPVLREVTDALLAGLDADTALGMVSERLRLAEFTLFASVIRLQRRAGGGISAAFSNLAETLRERRTLAAEGKGLHGADAAYAGGADANATAGARGAEHDRARVRRHALQYREGPELCCSWASGSSSPASSSRAISAHAVPGR